MVMTPELQNILTLAIQAVVFLLVSVTGYMMKQAVGEMKTQINEAIKGVQEVQKEVAVFKVSHESLNFRVAALEVTAEDLRKKHYDMREKLLEMKLNQAQGPKQGSHRDS